MRTHHAFVAVIATLAIAAHAEAVTVTYDWARTVSGTIPEELVNGDDNWGVSADTDVTVHAPALASGQTTNRIFTANGSVSNLTRQNDASWSLPSISNYATASVEFNVRTTGQGEIGFVDSSGALLFSAGSYHIGGLDIGYYIRRPILGTITTQEFHPTSGAIWYKLRMTVNMGAFGGDGAGTLEVAAWDGSQYGPFQPTSILNTNMNFLAASVTGSDITGLYAMVRSSNAVGNPTISVVPEPSTLGLLSLGLIGLGRRRRKCRK